VRRAGRGPALQRVLGAVLIATAVVMIAGADIANLTDRIARDNLKQRMDERVAEQLADAHALHTLFEIRERFSRALRQTADEAERQLVDKPVGLTHAGELSTIYAWVAEFLEAHTGSRVSIRPTSPDARFVRKVIEHAGLPWHPWVWRGIRTWEVKSRSVRNRCKKNR